YKRIWNYHDVVPHAFIPDELTNISTIYRLDGLEKNVLDRLTADVANAVRDKHYKQPCGTGVPLDCTLKSGLPLLAQIIHQHLDGYLENYALNTEMSAASLLAPTL